MRLGKHCLCGLLFTLSLWGCGSQEAHPPSVASNPPTTLSEEKRVEVTEVLPRTISYTVSAVGSLKPLENVTISPKKAGIINQILVKEGDRVTKGQILVQLDDVDARLQVEMSEAKMKQAEAAVETNRNIIPRYRKLHESRVIPQQTLDELVLKVKVDEARFDLAKAELIHVLGLLDERTHFNVIWYGTYVYSWSRRGLKKATSEARKDAQGRVRGLDIAGNDENRVLCTVILIEPLVHIVQRCGFKIFHIANNRPGIQSRRSDQLLQDMNLAVGQVATHLGRR